LKGVILAAGKGTRMLPLTERRPKPLVPVLDRPMIEHIIVGAREAGVDHLALVVGYLGHMIQEACGDGSALGVRIEYIWQEHAGGTGAATLLAADFIGDDPFFLSWGDIIVAPETYANVTRIWQDERPDAVLSLNVVADPWEGAAVYVVDGFIDKIIEKPPRGTSTTNYNNAGIFVFPPDILALLRDTPPSARGEVEVPDAIQAMLRRGARIRGVEVVGYWSDVARPSAVLELNRAMINYRAADGIVIIGDTHVEAGVRLTPPVFIGQNCHVGAASLGPNVTLGPETVVEDGAQLRETATFGHCRIPAGANLAYVMVEEDAPMAPGGVAGTAEAPRIIRTG
jgi:NDP-sugar pyrophosphorylase family protein